MAGTRLKTSPRQIAVSVLGLIVFGALLYWGGRNALDSIVGGNPGYLAAFFAVAFVSTLISAVRWAFIINWFLGHEGTRFKVYYRSFALSRVSGIFLPQAVGDLAVRPIIHGLATRSSYVDAFAGSVTERLSDVLLALAMSVPAMLYLFDIIDSTWFLASMAATSALWTLAMVGMGPFILRWAGAGITVIDRFAYRIGAGRFVPPVVSSGEFVERLNRASTIQSAITKVAVLSIVRYFLIGMYFVLLAYALRLDDLGMVVILAALPLAQIGTVIAITPGGIGFLEGGFFGAFALLQVSNESIMAYLIAQRVLVTLNLLIHGAVSLTITGRRSASVSEHGVLTERNGI